MKALGRQWRVELALDPMVAVPGRLAVPNEYELSWRGSFWNRKFGRFRARCCDLDAYTNFLLKPDRYPPIDQEKDRCNRTAH
jgi:hypothetical protein